MSDYPDDIDTGPTPDPDTLATLGRVARIAGAWESAVGESR